MSRAVKAARWVNPVFSRTINLKKERDSPRGDRPCCSEAISLLVVLAV